MSEGFTSKDLENLATFWHCFLRDNSDCDLEFFLRVSNSHSSTVFKQNQVLSPSIFTFLFNFFPPSFAHSPIICIADPSSLLRIIGDLFVLCIFMPF